MEKQREDHEKFLSETTSKFTTVDTKFEVDLTAELKEINMQADSM